MTGRVEGAVAFITGAGRGQGRGDVIWLVQGDAGVIAAGPADRVDAACMGRGGLVARPLKEGGKP